MNNMFIPFREGLIVINSFFTGLLILTNRVKEQELCTPKGQELRFQCL
ncbi:MAG: hypothetical protein K6E76_06365 [Patescibacteria group bacterium]|nr:hypothetical protein [Patescibacteria group bacterium]